MLNADTGSQEEFSKEEMSKLRLEECVSVKETNQSCRVKNKIAYP